MNKISPKYLMKLISDVNAELWNQYSSYKDIQNYIEKWHENNGNGYDYWENFPIVFKEESKIDLIQTLHKIDGDTILKIAIDLGIETPDFIPSIPTFRNEIKSDYKTASATFEKAFCQVEEHPDIAIGLANSALESILKEILTDGRISSKVDSKRTLYELTSDLLKEFQLYPNEKMPVEIKTIGSSLLAINQSIEKLRSEKTNMHGKTASEYVVEDSLYAFFIINSVATVGLFLKSFYEKKFTQLEPYSGIVDEDLPF